MRDTISEITIYRVIPSDNTYWLIYDGNVHNVNLIDLDIESYKELPILTYNNSHIGNVDPTTLHILNNELRGKLILDSNWLAANENINIHATVEIELADDNNHLDKDRLTAVILKEVDESEPE